MKSAVETSAEELKINDIRNVVNFDYHNSSKITCAELEDYPTVKTNRYCVLFLTQNSMSQAGMLLSIVEGEIQEVPSVLKFYASFVKQRKHLVCKTLEKER